jgi:hypothetical protein
MPATDRLQMAGIVRQKLNMVSCGCVMQVKPELRKLIEAM